MNIVVIGNGMYTAGIGTSAFGTILPALIEHERFLKNKNKIHIIGRNKINILKAKQKYNKLKKISGVSLDIYFYPEKRKSANYRDILKKIPHPICAIIAVPDHKHYEVVKYCLKLDIHCLVVKPFVLETKHARELCNIAEKKKLIGMVEFHKRYDRSNKLAKTKLNESMLGTLNHVAVDYSQRKEIPVDKFKKWSNKTNIFNYLGVHYVDIVQFITGGSPKRVMAIGQNNYLKSKKIMTYDTIQCLIEWTYGHDNNFIQSINVGWIDPRYSSAMSNQKMKLIGTKGIIELDQKNRGIEFNSDSELYEHINPDFNQSYIEKNYYYKWEGYGIESINIFLQQVKKYLLSKITLEDVKNNYPSFFSSVNSVRVSEGVNKSLNSGNNWIKL